MNELSVPVLPRGVRRHFDKVRGVPVLLGPERVLMLDEIGCAILDQVDGVSTLDEISSRLAEIYAAPKDDISTDVAAFLTDLGNKKLLDSSHD
ncbi:MAG: pyrroloquinoline quinone biosynthesis peptide chaperone PqqD [Roseobacter sp.]